MKNGRAVLRFTLLEVVVAVSIFALALTSVLALAGSASRRTDRAIKRWESQHYMAQAAEFFIITGFEKDTVPDEFFPNDVYGVKFELQEPEGLPEDMESNDSDKWQLKTVNITISDKSSGEEKDSLKFDRIIYQESQ